MVWNDSLYMCIIEFLADIHTEATEAGCILNKAKGQMQDRQNAYKMGTSAKTAVRYLVAYL